MLVRHLKQNCQGECAEESVRCLQHAFAWCHGRSIWWCALDEAAEDEVLPAILLHLPVVQLVDVALRFASPYKLTDSACEPHITTCSLGIHTQSSPHLLDEQLLIVHNEQRAAAAPCIRKQSQLLQPDVVHHPHLQGSRHNHSETPDYGHRKPMLHTAMIHVHSM